MERTKSDLPKIGQISWDASLRGMISAGANQHGYKNENGYGHAGGLKDTHTFSNGGETWIEVCHPLAPSLHA